ncbi:YraN family protein [Undibacterium sp. Jales W-56]|uniref:YraN family protein n=1 Tax=Undibacterium sp. Jales W-56 TaxID=2897325 RepID=UPI0021D051DB|nr:YraN family protein [Undibacterium sp. Jales W-56]MCU6434949.1 YraN family protein [Undibacterium sp. Jales W-56]
MAEQSWLSQRLAAVRTSRQRTGDEGEEQALAYLLKAGLTLVQRSFSCKGGELDLIMLDRATLVFVEVRKRSSRQFGGAVASITPAKQRRMTHAAQVYLQQQSAEPACRFDVVAIDDAQIRWLKNVIVA